MAPGDQPTIPDDGPRRPTRLAGLAAAGERIGRYTVVARAGVGGMAVVFRARDEALERDVALKLIVPEYAGDARWRARLEEESRAIAGLEHPHVVPVYEHGEDAGRLYIAMRYVDGPTLARVIADGGPLPAAEAVAVVRDLASALDAAHRRGIVHGDVKPGNVLLADDDGRRHVYLSDFGVGVRGGRTPEWLRPLRWAGTAGYAAPELIRGRPGSPASDVYALGCLLVECLTGRPPFTGPDREAVLAAHLADPPPRVTAAAPGLPAAMDAVVARALAKHPDARFPTAGALAEAAAGAGADLALLHGPGQAAAAAVLAGALHRDGLTAWWSAQGGDRNAAGLARAVAVLAGAGADAGLGTTRLALATARATADGAVAGVLLPGAGEVQRATLRAAGIAAIIDMRAGLDDPDAVRRLARLAGRDPEGAVAVDVPDDDGPYPGLAPYEPGRAAYFVGREEETEALSAAVARGGLVAVVGASGAGKSSLVRAGLLPALAGRPDAPLVAVTVPGGRPVEAVLAAVEAVCSGVPPAAAELRETPAALGERVAAALGPEGRRLVLVLDQAEELFGPEVPPADRDAVADALACAAAPGGALDVVLVLRADALPALQAHPALAAAAARGRLVVGPLSPGAVRRVVEEPAARAGLALEPGLARRITDDLAERPGALPLLNHLMRELWRRRRGRTLTLAAYADGGGVQGALARRANEVLEGLGPGRREVARLVLLRLVQPGDGAEDGRRRVPLTELDGIGGPGEVEAVLAALADARLVTLGGDGAGRTAEVAHEALIRGWWVLRGWVDADRDRLRAERRLTAAAAEWAAAGHDEASLLRGAALAGWQERGDAGLSAAERAYLAAGRDAAARGARAARRRRRTLAGAAVAVIVLLTGAVTVAVWQRQDAAAARDRARAQVLALDARDRLARDPAAALATAVRAAEARPTAAAFTSLRRALAADPQRGTARLSDAPLLAVAVARDGRVVAGGLDGTVRVWDPASGAVSPPIGAGSPVADVAVASGRVLVAHDDGALRAHPLDGGPDRTLAGPGGTLYALDVSPGGRLVAAVGDGGALRLYRADDLRALTPVPLPGGGGYDVAFAGDGRTVAVALPDGSVRAWAVTAGAVPAGPGRALGADLDAVYLAAGRPGEVLAAGGTGDGRVWSLAPGRPPREIGATYGGLPLLGAARGGAAVVTSGPDRSLRIGDRRLGSTVGLPQSKEARAVAAAPDGTLVSVHNDGSARRWDPAALPEGRRVVAGPVRAAALDPGGRRVALAAGSTVAVAGTAGGRAVVRRAPGVEALRLAPGVAVPVVARGGLAGPLGRPAVRVAAPGAAYEVVLDPSGARMAAVDDGGRLRVRDARTGRPAGRVPRLPRGQGVFGVAFAGGPDRLLLAVSRPGESTVRIVPADLRTGAVGGRGERIPFPAVIAAAPDGRLAITGSQVADSLSVVDTTGGPVRRLPYDRPVSALDVGPRVVAVGATSGDVTVAALDGSWSVEGVLSFPGPVADVRLRAGVLTAAGLDGTVRRVRCEACAPDAAVLALAGARTAADPLARDRAGGTG